MGTFLVSRQKGTYLKQVRPLLPAERGNEECPHYLFAREYADWRESASPGSFSHFPGLTGARCLKFPRTQA